MGEQSLTKSSTIDSVNAYVFYATQDAYACSIMVNVLLLKTIFHTRYRIVVLVSHEVSEQYHSSLQALGATVVEEEPMPLHPDSISYYHGCLLKLAAFRMHEIDPRLRRVLVLDSDQLILQSLDHLFDYPPADFLAPSAYWIDDSCLSSTLMLIQPSRELWGLVRRAMANISSQQYDMDLINVLFHDPSVRLPGSYVTLNSHWEDKNLPSWFESKSTLESLASDWDLYSLYLQAHVIHFTAVGKPWTYDMDTVQRMKPYAHDLLLKQWERWRSVALVTCPTGVLDNV
ncbi:alphaN-acetylglucosamine transferase [Ilyonectria sp. MPI-CAGE-AT-0026]|nr:alphaN-acetylglucosamine transferase [Ilyonectria sp. MPI-CAGE-AT-0026]